MKIRQEQMGVLSLASLRRFAGRMVEILPTRFPKEVEERHLQERQHLEAAILEGIQRAKGHGVLNEADVERFLECAIIFGPEFDEDAGIPWAQEILTRKNLDGEQKMDAIDEHRIFSLDEPR